MNTFSRLLLLSSLLLPLSACNDSTTSNPLPDPGSNSIPRDEGQNLPPSSTPAPKAPDSNTGGSPSTGDAGPNQASGATGNGGSGGGGNPSAPVPEPGTLLLVGTGLALLANHRRRKARLEAKAEGEE